MADRAPTTIRSSIGMRPLLGERTCRGNTISWPRRRAAQDVPIRPSPRCTISANTASAAAIPRSRDGRRHRAHLARRVAEAGRASRPPTVRSLLEENQRLSIGRRGDAHHGGEGIRQDRRPLGLHGSEVGIIEPISWAPDSSAPPSGEGAGLEPPHARGCARGAGGMARPQERYPSAPARTRSRPEGRIPRSSASASGTSAPPALDESARHSSSVDDSELGQIWASATTVARPLGATATLSCAAAGTTMST